MYDKFLKETQNCVAPGPYQVPVRYTGEMIIERDVEVTMRDGVRLYVDIYRPDTTDKLPALLSLGPHNKDYMRPELTDECGAQPAWSSVWNGMSESGDNRYLISRGYVHVVSNLRGLGKNDDGPQSDYDGYDLVEWMAQQPWCDGRIGGIGTCYFGFTQLIIAEQQPPHLKCIAPFELNYDDFYERGFYTGGVHHLVWYCLTSGTNPCRVGLACKNVVPAMTKELSP